MVGGWTGGSDKRKALESTSSSQPQKQDYYTSQRLRVIRRLVNNVILQCSTTMLKPPVIVTVAYIGRGAKDRISPEDKHKGKILIQDLRDLREKQGHQKN